MGMIKLENLGQDEINTIGMDVGLSFYSDDGSYKRLMTESECIAYFTACVEVCSARGVLYTTSANQEGYLGFWHKSDKPNMAGTLMKYMYRESMHRFMSGLRGWEGHERYYRDMTDYLSLFLVVVRNEYKGKGFSRKVLEFPFEEADREKIPCLLDTDTREKSKLYQHLGMRVCRQKKLDSGIEMFTMIYP